MIREGQRRYFNKIDRGDFNKFLQFDGGLSLSLSLFLCLALQAGVVLQGDEFSRWKSRDSAESDK